MFSVEIRIKQLHLRSNAGHVTHRPAPHVCRTSGSRGRSSGRPDGRFTLIAEGRCAGLGRVGPRRACSLLWLSRLAILSTTAHQHRERPNRIARRLNLSSEQARRGPTRPSPSGRDRIARRLNLSSEQARRGPTRPSPAHLPSARGPV